MTIKRFADGEPCIRVLKRDNLDLPLLVNRLKLCFMTTLTDKQLHELAHKRVEFKTHLIAYGIVISTCWIIWAIMGQHYPWPVWPMAGWGVGLVFHYLFEYQPSKFLSEEEEYRKLKGQSERHGHMMPE